MITHQIFHNVNVTRAGWALSGGLVCDRRSVFNRKLDDVIQTHIRKVEENERI